MSLWSVPGARSVLRCAALLSLHAVWSEFFPGRAAPSKWIPSYAGPFVLYMDRMYGCPTPSNKENMFEVHIRPSHFRTPSLVQTTLQTISGNCTWKSVVDDTWAGNLKSDVWTNNQWKENSIIYRMPKNFCSTVRTNFPGLYETIYQANASSNEPCKFPKKVNIFDNTTINWTLPNFPLLPYGRFRTTSTAWSFKKKKEACFVFEVVIVPRV